MAAQVLDHIGNAMRYRNATGANDNDPVIETQDVSKYDTFMLMSTAGALDVFVSLDGTNFSTSALSLTDLGATSAAPVVVTAANRIYGFRGTYAKIRVDQNGATPVTAACLVASCSGE